MIFLRVFGAECEVQVNELAEAINEIIPTLSKNKVGTIPKMTLYRQLMQKNYFQRSQSINLRFSPTLYAISDRAFGGSSSR